MCDGPCFEVCPRFFQFELDLQNPWNKLIPAIGNKEKPLPPTLVD
jgi:hypothetical protein